MAFYNAYHFGHPTFPAHLFYFPHPLPWPPQPFLPTPPYYNAPASTPLSSAHPNYIQQPVPYGNSNTHQPPSIPHTSTYPLPHRNLAHTRTFPIRPPLPSQPPGKHSFAPLCGPHAGQVRAPRPPPIASPSTPSALGSTQPGSTGRSTNVLPAASSSVEGASATSRWSSGGSASASTSMYARQHAHTSTSLPSFSSSAAPQTAQAQTTLRAPSPNAPPANMREGVSQGAVMPVPRPEIVMQSSRRGSTGSVLPAGGNHEGTSGAHSAIPQSSTAPNSTTTSSPHPHPPPHAAASVTQTPSTSNASGTKGKKRTTGASLSIAPVTSFGNKPLLSASTTTSNAASDQKTKGGSQGGVLFPIKPQQAGLGSAVPKMVKGTIPVAIAGSKGAVGGAGGDMVMVAPSSSSTTNTFFSSSSSTIPPLQVAAVVKASPTTAPSKSTKRAAPDIGSPSGQRAAKKARLPPSSAALPITPGDSNASQSGRSGQVGVGPSVSGSGKGKGAVGAGGTAVQHSLAGSTTARGTTITAAAAAQFSSSSASSSFALPPTAASACPGPSKFTQHASSSAATRPGQGRKRGSQNVPPATGPGRKRKKSRKIDTMPTAQGPQGPPPSTGPLTMSTSSIASSSVLPRRRALIAPQPLIAQQASAPPAYHEDIPADWLFRVVSPPPGTVRTLARLPRRAKHALQASRSTAGAMSGSSVVIDGVVRRHGRPAPTEGIRPTTTTADLPDFSRARPLDLTHMAEDERDLLEEGPKGPRSDEFLAAAGIGDRMLQSVIEDELVALRPNAPLEYLERAVKPWTTNLFWFEAGLQMGLDATYLPYVIPIPHNANRLFIHDRGDPLEVVGGAQAKRAWSKTMVELRRKLSPLLAHLEDIIDREVKAMGFGNPQANPSILSRVEPFILWEGTDDPNEAFGTKVSVRVKGLLPGEADRVAELVTVQHANKFPQAEWRVYRTM